MGGGGGGDGIETILRIAYSNLYTFFYLFCLVVISAHQITQIISNESRNQKVSKSILEQKQIVLKNHKPVHNRQEWEGRRW
jgi:hypothetical protein